MARISYNILPSKEPGYNTIVLHQDNGADRYLHSAIAPSREKESLAEQIRSSAKDTIIVLGCGLGYHLHPLLSLPDIRNIIIIDILEDIQEYACKEPVPEELCRRFNVHWITGNDIIKVETSLKNILNLEDTASIFICEHPSSLRLFPDFYSSCRKIIDDCIRHQAGNIATKRSFGRLYQKNIIKNTEHFKKAYPVRALKNIFKNESAVIISSAPSADIYINQLKTQSGRLIIFCVDSAYAILRKHNIRPDIVLSIDPQPWTEQHLDGIDADIPVIYSLSSWKNSIPHRVQFFSLSSHPFCQILEHLHPDAIGSIDSGTGSVAGDAIQAALYTGCSEIYLCGLDFSFPGHCIYSKDSIYNKRFSGFQNSRILPNESLHMSYIRRSGRKTRMNGIATRESFLQFKTQIEHLIENSDAKVYHLKGNGLEIQGTSSVQLIAKENDSVKKTQLINKLSTLSTIGSLINNHSFLSFLSKTDILSSAVSASSGHCSSKEIAYIQSFITHIKKNTEKQ